MKIFTEKLYEQMSKESELKESKALKRARKDAMLKIGDRLYQVRTQKGLSQLEMLRRFSETTPASVSGYSKWENGNTPIDFLFLIQLHEEWGVSLNWLFFGEGEAF